MIIERVSKKDDNTVIVYLDNKGKLFLSYEVLIKNGLRKGAEISDDRFELLVIQNRKYHIRQKIISFLAKRVHSKRELEIKLRKKNYEKQLISEVLDELEEKGLIDDKVFAAQFADEKLNLKKWGILKVKSELLKKGVSGRMVDEVLSVYSDSDNQIRIALELGSRKLNLVSKREDDKTKIKQKVVSFLLSRGFNYDIIKEVVEKIINDDKNYE